MTRPQGNNADEWHAFLAEHVDALGYVAVQIAEALDVAYATTATARHPQTIDTDALRKLCGAAPKNKMIQDGQLLPHVGSFYFAWLFNAPAILDELDRLRAAGAEQLSQAEINEAIGNMVPEEQSRLRQEFPEGVCFHGVRIDLECRACARDASPPPAAADRGVPEQNTDEAWDRYKVGLGNDNSPLMREAFKAGFRAALAAAPKAEYVRREAIEQAACAAMDALNVGSLHAVPIAIRALAEPVP